MNTAEEIAEEIVFETDRNEGEYPISMGAELIKQYAIEFAGEYYKWTELNTNNEAVLKEHVTAFYNEWISTQKQQP